MKKHPFHARDMQIFCNGRKKNFYFTLALLLFIITCGQKSKVDCSQTNGTNCVPQSSDERALHLINEEKFDEAITLLLSLINETQTVTNSQLLRRVRLASAYAGKAGFDIFSIMTSISNDDTSAISSNTALTETDLPQIKNEIELLELASEQLKEVFIYIPYSDENDSLADKEKYFYRSSAQFQQSLYAAIHVNNCNSVYSYISEDLDSRQDLIIDFSACNFSNVLDNLDIFINVFATIAPDCTSCADVVQGFKDKKIEYENTVAEISGEDDEEKINKILEEECIKKRGDVPECTL